MKRIDHRNQTTLITGASSGIGVEFARQLAARGSNIVLVARRKERLEALAAELEAAHGIRAWAIPLDLTLPDAGRLLAEAVAERGISVTSVINNAGFGTHGLFHASDAHQLREQITLNVTNLVDISRSFVEPLRANGSGYLINVASMAAYFPSPKMAVYAATKAFVLNFTEALWQESLDSGLRVLTVSPGATATEFGDTAGADAYGNARLRPPSDVVETALRELERTRSRPSVAVGRANRSLTTLIRLFSRRRLVLIAANLTP